MYTHSVARLWDLFNHLFTRFLIFSIPHNITDDGNASTLVPATQINVNVKGKAVKGKSTKTNDKKAATKDKQQKQNSNVGKLHCTLDNAVIFRNKNVLSKHIHIQFSMIKIPT